MYRKLLLFLILMQMGGNGIAQKSFQNVMAPEIKLSEIRSAKYRPDNLAGRHIILEFWATWCGSCINAIPHFNKMARKYQSDSLLFISINSFDSREKIQAFLQKTKMESLVAMDDEKQTYDSLGIKLIPATFLIDKHGYLRWRGTPGLITEEFMDTFLMKDKVLVPDLKNPLLYTFSISYAQEQDKSSVSIATGNQFGFHFKNRSLTNILEQMYSFLEEGESEVRFMGKVPLEPKVNLEFVADTTMSFEYVFDDVLSRLSLIFDFEIKEYEGKREIWYLHVTDQELLDKALAEDQEEEYDFEEKEGKEHFYNIELYDLLPWLTSFEDQIFRLEEDIPGKFDLTFPIDDFDTVLGDLTQRYGIGIKSVEEKILVREIKFF